MLMRSLPLLLLAGVALVLMAAGEADAGKEPEWNYTADYIVKTVAISADGEYIVSGTYDYKVYLFNKTVPVSVEEDDTNEVDSKNDDTSEEDSENDDSNEIKWYQLEVVVVVILAGLFHLRRDTDPSETPNKILRLLLYGIAILLLVASAIILFIGRVTMNDEPLIDSEDNPWKIWILNAALFALTGAYLGHETYDPGPSSSYKSSIPASKPIFSDRRETPVFTPQNELTTIECPGCSAQMEVPILGAMQKVTCDECGTSGEIEI